MYEGSGDPAASPPELKTTIIAPNDLNTAVLVPQPQEKDCNDR
jgi:hypothetical protein